MLKIIKNRTLATASIVVAMGMSVISADAKPATPREILYTQPDGSRISVVLRGDERAHAYYLPDGTPLFENADGSLTVMPKELRQAYKEISEAHQRKYIISGAPFPSEGDPHALVILVEFQDRKFTMDDPQDYFNRLLNEEGFSDYGANGSARDYFIFNSNGKFRPTFDVFGPVMLRERMTYYGSNNLYGNDMHPEEMCVEACTQLDDQINFSNYDLNGDGYIDNLYIFYAGFGEADSGYRYTIWPHSANISEYELGEIFTFDDVILDRYGMSNEIDYSYGRPDSIGTFVHEFSHVLGIPDLYCTNYSFAFTPSDYSVMDRGSYNDQGRTPPNYSIFERMSLEWLTPELFPTAEESQITIEPIHTSNTGYIIPCERDNEFFLFENRQNEGGDRFIPGHGMLVWHIDFQQRAWDNNIVNNVRNYQRIDLVEADNSLSSSTRSGDTFPGTSNVTKFSFKTLPSLATHDGADLGYSLSNITEKDGLITFDLSYSPPISGIEDISSDWNDWLNVENGKICNSGQTEIKVFDASGSLLRIIAPGESGYAPKGLIIIVNGEDSKKIFI